MGAIDVRRLGLELNKFFAAQMGLRGDHRLHVIEDLIILRCKNALAPAELEIGAMKAGRVLVKEVGERVCRELRPRLDCLLREITGLQLLEVRVDLFWSQREKAFLFSISDNIKLERRAGEHS